MLKKCIFTGLMILLILFTCSLCPLRAEDYSSDFICQSEDSIPRIDTEQSYPTGEENAGASPTLSDRPVSGEAPELKRNREILRERIKAFVNSQPVWNNSKVGIYVAVLDSGAEIFAKNPNLPMIPASNLKVVTTAMALASLGPDYQFETSIWGGNIDSHGTMEGNLYLKGTGDPTYMEPFTNQPMEVFEKMVIALKKRGLKTINGDFIGDDSAFDREFLGRGWKPRYLHCDYAAPAGALSVNANLVQIVVGNDYTRLNPDNNYIRIVNSGSGSGDVYITRKLGTDTVCINGRPAGTVYRTITINNPSKFTTFSVARLLKKHGIKINGTIRLISDGDLDYQSRTSKICFHKSIPLKKIVREINKESDNVLAQHVFKAIGYTRKGKGSCDNSNTAIKEILSANRLNPNGLSMADGSGLSEYNRITPHQLSDILRFIYKHPSGKVFYESLPIAGKDGTLSYRMAGLPVRAKTGTIQGHVALSGYVTTAGGQKLVFSIITNYHRYSSDSIRGLEDQLVSILASCGYKL